MLAPPMHPSLSTQCLLHAGRQADALAQASTLVPPAPLSTTAPASDVEAACGIALRALLDLGRFRDATALCANVREGLGAVPPSLK